jgi:hypothetical protein
MEVGFAVESHHTEAGLGILAQGGVPARAPAQSSASALWLSTFTCG